MVSSVNRMSGLSSGMDTDQLVKNLIKTERAPLDKLLRNKQKESWRRDSYRDMNSLLLEFRNNIISPLRLQGTFLKNTVTSSNDSVVSVKTVGKPQSDNNTVKVNRLAEPAQPSAVKFVNSIKDENTKIDDDFSITVQGSSGTSKTITVEKGNTIKDVIQKINEVSGDSKVRAVYLPEEKSISFVSTETGRTKGVSISVSDSSNALNIKSTYMAQGTAIDLSTTPIDTSTANKMNFTIGGVSKEITLSTSKVYDGSTGKGLNELAQDIQAEINKDPALVNANLKASIVDGKLTFSATDEVKVKPGSSNDLRIGIGFSGASTTLATGSFFSGNDGISGQVVINGVTHDVTSNTFKYDGIEYTLKKVSSDSVSIVSKPDENAIFDSVKKFVDEYNKLIDTLNTKISEQVNRDYKPLLDEEKEAMGESTVKLWEDKAKSGLLRKDPIISNLLSGMRLSLNSIVSGGSDPNSKSLADIGISSVTRGGSVLGSYKENGKLYIDEDKLRKAIREKGNEVMDLFTKSSDSSNPTEKEANSGIAQRLYNQLNTSINGIIDKAGATGSSEGAQTYLMGRQMAELNNQIGRWEDKIEKMTERYYAKFTAMEKALNKLNSQSSWLSQQFSTTSA